MMPITTTPRIWITVTRMVEGKRVETSRQIDYTLWRQYGDDNVRDRAVGREIETMLLELNCG